MHADLDRLLTPYVPGVLEVADQCLLLGIGADDRVSIGCKRVLLRRNVLKLCVARGMVRAGFFLLRIDPQPVSGDTTLLRWASHRGGGTGRVQRPCGGLGTCQRSG
jgi:hypothetical protein